METLDKSDPDSVQIKAALLDQIKQYGGCFQWPEDLGGGNLPDVSGAGIVGSKPQHDVAGYADDFDYKTDDYTTGTWSVLAQHVGIS